MFIILAILLILSFYVVFSETNEYMLFAAILIIALSVVILGFMLSGNI